MWMGVPWLSDARFYYNMWMHYSVIEPDKLDPSLRTEEQFNPSVLDATENQGTKGILARHGFRAVIRIALHRNDAARVSSVLVRKLDEIGCVSSHEFTPSQLQNGLRRANSDSRGSSSLPSPYLRSCCSKGRERGGNELLGIRISFMKVPRARQHDGLGSSQPPTGL